MESQVQLMFSHCRTAERGSSDRAQKRQYRVAMQMGTHCLYTAGHRSGCLCQIQSLVQVKVKQEAQAKLVIVCSMVQSMVKIMSYESQARGSHRTCLLLSSATSNWS